MSVEQNDPLRLVAVDDSPSVIAHFKQLVSEMTGVQVIEPGWFRGSIAQEEGVPDLVVMDIVMPRMDGLTTLRTMKATYPDIRVAMLSSVAGSRSRAEEAFRLGAVQVITKPFDGPKLRDLFGAEKTHKGGKG